MSHLGCVAVLYFFIFFEHALLTSEMGFWVLLKTLFAKRLLVFLNPNPLFFSDSRIETFRLSSHYFKVHMVWFMPED